MVGGTVGGGTVVVVEGTVDGGVVGVEAGAAASSPWPQPTSRQAARPSGEESDHAGTLRREAELVDRDRGEDHQRHLGGHPQAEEPVEERGGDGDDHARWRAGARRPAPGAATR